MINAPEFARALIGALEGRITPESAGRCDLPADQMAQVEKAAQLVAKRAELAEQLLASAHHFNALADQLRQYCGALTALVLLVDTADTITRADVRQVLAANGLTLQLDPDAVPVVMGQDVVGAETYLNGLADFGGPHHRGHHGC